MNKAQIYAYFGDKLGLFHAVYRMHADAVVDATPFTPDDLPGYAVGLYDAAVARPELFRLVTWARLEGVGADGLAAGGGAGAWKVQAIAEAQRTGAVTADLDPADVLALVTAMALAWSAAGWSVVAGPGDPDRDHERRRRRPAHRRVGRPRRLASRRFRPQDPLTMNDGRRAGSCRDGRAKDS